MTSSCILIFTERYKVSSAAVPDIPTERRNYVNVTRKHSNKVLLPNRFWYSISSISPLIHCIYIVIFCMKWIYKDANIWRHTTLYWKVKKGLGGDWDCYPWYTLLVCYLCFYLYCLLLLYANWNISNQIIFNDVNSNYTTRWLTVVSFGLIG